MKKLQIILAACLCCLSISSFSQKVLLESNVKADSVTPSFGRNRQNYVHLFFDYSFYLGREDEDGGRINYGLSRTITEGFRYKAKVSNYYAAGFDFFFSQYNYDLEQVAGKKIQDTTFHDHEKLVFENMGLSIYSRINFGKRGDRIGNFFDVAVYGNWTYSVRHVSKDTYNLTIGQNATDVKVVKTGLPYTENYNYGIAARLGFNRIAFTFTYRLSNLFKNSYGYPELPRYTAGLQIGLHK